jgi:cobaltochelatase CobT
MRGEKIKYTAAWSAILMEWFESVGINAEVLGFTTRAWKGGQTREEWIVDGKPRQPGRLNDLRHIVYKSFTNTVREAGLNLGVMLREGLLKENVDGEALLWAYKRLMTEDATHRLLFVISDGVPVDDSTLSVNRGNFLSDHLKAVTSWIESEGDVFLVGIGIQRDEDEPYYSSHYYRNAEQITDLRGLGLPVLRVVASSLKGK